MEKIKFDPEVFKNLCAMCCTTIEICSVMGLSKTTLSKYCKEIFGMGLLESQKIFRSIGYTKLRSAGYQMALDNPQMWKFFATNYLVNCETGKLMTDKQSIDVTTDGEKLGSKIDELTDEQKMKIVEDLKEKGIDITE